MEHIRAVIVGYGGMGSKYAQIIYENHVNGMALSGICCRNKQGQKEIARLYPDISIYSDTDNLFAHPDEFDAVIIATPHNTHVSIGKQAAAHGKHMLCDKPLGVCAKEVRELFVAAKTSEVAIALIFNMRANRGFRIAKEILDSGRLGKLSRAVWVCNTFFRTPAYHNSASWRSTWQGEHGGLLLNQFQHYLDVWLWLFGMPTKVDAALDYGKFNDIQVDDNLDLRLIYDNGMRGNILCSTGETPGTNRLELWGTKGRLTVEHNMRVILDENDIASDQFSAINTDIYGTIKYKTQDMTIEQDVEPYTYIFNGFAAHVLHGQPLVADGQDGLNSLLVANAGYLSSWTDKPVEFPMDEELYAALLEEKAR